MTYLDHDASSPLLPVAREAWLDAVARLAGNPSSLHRPGARADRALDEARQQLATALGCAPANLIWTSGATEACAAALHHAAATAGPEAVAWVSAVEHPAVRENARHFFAGRVREMPVDARGVVQRDWLTERRRQGERPAVVAVMAANNETGVRQPWREVAAWCAAEGVTFFCDATQWCGRLPGRGLGDGDFVAGTHTVRRAARGGFSEGAARKGVSPVVARRRAARRSPGRNGECRRRARDGGGAGLVRGAHGRR